MTEQLHDRNSINIDSDEDARRKKRKNNKPSNATQCNSNLEFRSFWKAGGYDVGPTKSSLEQGELEHARVHPKFLHSNATSHKWAFGAIAELLDNAVDEIGKGATFVKLDKISNKRDDSPALLFQDNGGGMDPECMRQCMSLGYSMKKDNTIGQYGNGFKTSTMRLGADVIVFSRTTRGSCATQSVGLLSYTFLRKTGQDDAIVPMDGNYNNPLYFLNIDYNHGLTTQIDFELSGNSSCPIIHSSQEDWSNNLNDILEWSPFISEQELMLQFEDIGSHGTKIIVYNLWLNDDSLLELDLDSDEEDIRLRDDVNLERSKKKFDKLAYASILYLSKFNNFSIILRGKPVEQYNVVDNLKFLEVVTYRPQLPNTSKEVSVKTEIGFVKEAPLLAVSGFNVYHKNRLIRPFWRVTSAGTSMGQGVIGILEANFIEPAHDKQDFERSALYLRLETRLKQMCLDFWKRKCHLLGFNNYYTQNIVGHNTEKEWPNQSFDIQPQFALDQPVIGLDCSGAKLADQISEENILLFARCENHRQKESELKQTIEVLERELAETKRKCSQLSSYLESQKKLRARLATCL